MGCDGRSGRTRDLVPRVRPHLVPTASEKGVSWCPIDLVAHAAEPPRPPDVIGLFYVGLNHLVSGESESAKSWLALAAAATRRRRSANGNGSSSVLRPGERALARLDRRARGRARRARASLGTLVAQRRGTRANSRSDINSHS